MFTRLQHLLGLRRGERGRALLLFLFLFLVISTYVAGKAARDALFLENYSAVRLPFADMAVAVVVGGLVGLYIRARRRMEIATLVVGSLLFFAATAVLLWWLGRSPGAPPWLSVIVYVWVGTIGVVGPAQVWTVANYVVTLREAKRLFGIVGSGAIAGWIAGGFMTTAMATRFGANGVLLAIAMALTLCAGLVVSLWRRRPVSLSQFDSLPEAGEEQPGSLMGGLAQVLNSPYLRSVAVLIGITSLVTGIAAWQFKAIAKEAIPATDDLAAFFGSFNSYAGVLALATQVVVTPRLLRRFGVGMALFVVPAFMMAGTVAVLAVGTLAAVVALKGSDQVLRYSIDKSTVELLFLPVSASQRFHAKMCIDGVVWRIGDAAGSLIVLVSAGAAGLSAVDVGWLNLLLIGVWLASAYLVYVRYVRNLADSVHQHRLDTERASAPVIDRSMNELIASKLAASEPNDVLYGMSLLEVSQGRKTHPAVRTLLQHDSPEVRARAVGILGEARDLSVLSAIEAMLNDKDVRVRTEALLYLAHNSNIDPLARIDELGNFEDFSIRSAMVAFLARRGPTQNLDAASLLLDSMVTEGGPGGARTRLEAARLIAILPNCFEPQLAALLEDPEPEVVRQAIRAAGRLCRRRFMERLIHFLGDPEFATDGAEALAQCGDRVVGTLRDHLVDDEVPIRLRREIPAVLARIGSQAAMAALMENLITADAVLRSRIVSGLGRLTERHPEYQVDRQAIETALVAEAMGHYRSYEILATLGAPAGELDDPVTHGLRESMKQELERIFRLLEMLSPEQDVRSAYVGVQSDNPVIHDKALELLDNVLRPQLRALLVPLCDSEVSTAERMELARRMLGSNLGSREEAVAALIYSEDPWLKACAAYSIGALGLTSLERELDKWLDDPDPLLRETARHSKAQLGGQAAQPKKAQGSGIRDRGSEGPQPAPESTTYRLGHTI
ncbi:MAG: Npt1/Npt2 family nucleotide transporter [Vicinamibacterales bacterium]